MSQGDPTFDATQQIAVLVGEIRYHSDPGEIIKAIQFLRTEANYLEEHPTWEARTSDEVTRISADARRFAREAVYGAGPEVAQQVAKQQEMLRQKVQQLEDMEQEKAFIAAHAPFAQPHYPYQQAASVGALSNGVNGLGFSGD